MYKTIKTLLCSHKYAFVRNIHPEQVCMTNLFRSVWECEHCEKVDLRPDLHIKADAK